MADERYRDRNVRKEVHMGLFHKNKQKEAVQEVKQPQISLEDKAIRQIIYQSALKIFPMKKWLSAIRLSGLKRRLIMF